MTARVVLVADEDKDTRVILRAVLERRQFTVVEAVNGDEAAAVFEQCGPCLVILNYPMSRADGRTLVSHLRAQVSGQQVPILNLTSRVVPHYLAEAANEGVDVTVPKPADVEVLLRIVADLVESRVPASAAS